MKKSLFSLFRNLICICAILLLSTVAKASHIVGVDLYYTWVTGNTYKITCNMYGDCGPSSATAFASLPTGTPQICILNGTTSIATINLAIQAPTAGIEITPVCPADSLNTQCHSTTSTIPGIKKFTYTGTYTLPTTSANWRFLFKGAYVSGTAGRAAAITNISSGTTIELEADLNNTVHHNSNPILTIVPTPFFCLNQPDNYNPGAVDADGDSLSFSLVSGLDGNTGGACNTGSAVSYTTAVLAWTPSTFISAATPLRVTAGTFAFDNHTGQIGFTPNFTQRALVVYTVDEFRNDTLIGSSQREMTFLVLTCTAPPPTGFISGTSNGTVDDATHYHICANTDTFSLYIEATEGDTTRNITVTTTGVPAWDTFTVSNNGTNHPVIKNHGTSTGVTPGFYTFYVTFRDDNCPINGVQTIAFTIGILPIPTISYAVVSGASCNGDAVLSISPGGLGNPWSIHVQDSATGNLIQLDSPVSGTFLDTLAVGRDSVIIYSSLSTFCSGRYGLDIIRPPFITPTATFTNPTICGANDGTITMSGLNPSELDTIKYTYNGVAQPPLTFLVPGTGSVVLTGLCDGIYNNLNVTYGIYCVSSQIGPYHLTNPNFPIGYAELFQNPSHCGYTDGIIKVHGLNPGQTDTLFYDLGGVPQTPVVAFVSADSIITVTNLGVGTYSNFYAKTQGACPNSGVSCVSNVVGPVTLTTPPITPGFSFVYHLGCKGDTVDFTNSSTPSGLYYRWYFGDGNTDTATNPSHIYYPSGASSYNVVMYITNTYCTDSIVESVSFTNVVSAGFTVAPDTVCQGRVVTMTNTSTGVAPTYLWDFGDGNTSTALNPTHIYNNTGLYNVTLVASDYIPCHDTMTKTVMVDSSSLISLNASDTVICKGGLITFTGTYTSIGNTGVQWTFGDGSSINNVNPVQHAFDITGNITVTMTADYETCPNQTITKNLRVYPYPTIYLGPDTSVCPGGSAILLSDITNAGNSLASWKWNTGDTTSGIAVTKSGNYAATVSIYGCAATDTVWVANDCYISFPNIFSPNGDGVNDYFFPTEILARGVTTFKMSIYNRWGQEIFATTSTDGSGWDGRLNSTPQPEGVYIYIIDATFKDGVTLHKQGNITLIR